MPKSLPVHIRWMIARDRSAVMVIESDSFPYWWTEDELIRILRQSNCIGMVAEYEERVVGFMVYELFRGKLHLLRLAVHAACRRQGVGSALLAKLAAHRRSKIEIVVRETNLEAQLFFQSQGLYATDCFREHFPDTGEDAIAFTYDLK